MKKLFLFILLFLLFPAPTFAQKASAPQLLVTPSIVRLDLATDKPQTNITYKNLTDSPLELSFSAQDFTDLNEGYQISFLSPKDANNYAYSLSSWIHFSSTTLLVDPHESGSVTVYIDSAKLSPGGHYTSILAHIQSSSIGQIGIQGTVGSLLFVRTHTGKENESASLASFESVRNFWDFPHTMTFRFINTGDTDLTPYGLIQIMDSNNIVVAKGIINQTSAPTLPKNIRRYYVSLRNLQPFFMPGIYKATIFTHFGQSNQKITQSFTFFSQGSIPLIPITIILLLVIFFWFWKRKKI